MGIEAGCGCGRSHLDGEEGRSCPGGESIAALEGLGSPERQGGSVYWQIDTVGWE